MHPAGGLRDELEWYHGKTKPFRLLNEDERAFFEGAAMERGAIWTGQAAALEYFNERKDF